MCFWLKVLKNSMFKNHCFYFLLQPIWTLSLQPSRGTRNPPRKIQDEEKTYWGTYRDAGGGVNIRTVELQEPNTVNRFQSFSLCLFLSSRFDKLGANESAAVGEKREKKWSEMRMKTPDTPAWTTESNAGPPSPRPPYIIWPESPDVRWNVRRPLSTAIFAPSVREFLRLPSVDSGVVTSPFNLSQDWAKQAGLDYRTLTAESFTSFSSTDTFFLFIYVTGKCSFTHIQYPHIIQLQFPISKSTDTAIFGRRINTF